MYEEQIKELRALDIKYKSSVPYEVLDALSEAADAIDELLKAAKAMHTWIFLNTGDEQAAYDDCGLSDELNAALGYCGAFEMLPDRSKEEKDDVG